jgi:hypothetical protein
MRTAASEELQRQVRSRRTRGRVGQRRVHPAGRRVAPHVRRRHAGRFTSTGLAGQNGSTNLVLPIGSHVSSSGGFSIIMRVQINADERRIFDLVPSVVHESGVKITEGKIAAVFSKHRLYNNTMRLESG